MADAFKPGDKAVWWNGPGHQSRAEVTVTEVDGDEVTFETPSYMHGRYETVRVSELEPMPESILTEEPPMTTSDLTPVVEVKWFHEAYPGMPLLYHTYCSACPNYGICGKREAAESDAWRHAQSHGTTVTPNDPTPGDHDELIARLGELAGRLVGFPGWHDVHDAIAALRTEQSARQAAERERNDAETAFNASMERCIAAEEREYTLIAGVKEALDRLALPYPGQSTYSPLNSAADWVPRTADARAILSRLLPSTSTEEGKNDDHS